MSNNDGSTARRAIIIGGGIAGMAAALALRKAGCAPEVFEAYPRNADAAGAFLTLASNGLEALRALDVDPASLGGFATPRFELHLGDGHRLAAFDFGKPSPDAAPARTITRAELYRVLRGAAEQRGIPVHYGRALEHAERDGAGVLARFADGSTARGDLLVGADGLRSKVRRVIDSAAPSARYIGVLNAGGVARGVRVAGEPGTMRMYFGKRCFFAYVNHPGGEVWWFANPERKTEPSAAELAAITPEAWRAELLRLFEHDVSPACEIVRATDKIFAGWPTFDFPRVPVWHRDGMLVIGDAAHAASPSSGQGASMAIEDAVVLGKALRDERDVAAAFARYEAARRARVERVVAEGKKGGDGKTPGALGRVLRDAIVRVMFARPQRDDPWAFLFRAPIRWAGRVEDDA